MGIIDNLDFANIDLNIFKNFKCPCELCDDGCFDRTNQVHHPECKKKSGIRKSSSFRSHSELKTSKKCFLTHYNETFKANYNPRPATGFIPPKDLFLYVPKGNMDFKTIQKVDFKKPQPQERVKPFKLEDNHERPTEPLSNVTAYRAEFLPKENNGLANMVKRNSNEPSLKQSTNIEFSTITTTKEHFKEWASKPLSRGYSEYPSYAGDSIFPNKERSFVTSTKTFHKPIDITKIEPSKKADVKTNLKTEGEMNLITSYRDNFVKYENNEPVQKISPQSQANNIINNSDKKKLISSITQNKADFVYYHGHVPPKPADVNTFISKLDQTIYPNNKRDHNTIYSTEFIPKEYVKTLTCKKEDAPYERPLEKVETETTTHRDFKAIDMSKIPVLKAIKIPKTHLKIPVGPMESKTVSMIQYVPYQVKPRVMYSDPNPDYYIPVNSKFESATTTNEHFKGLKGERAKLLKPNEEHIKIDKSKTIESTTSYKNSFKNHGLSMCEAKAYIIAHHLAQMKEQANTTLLNSNPNSVQA